LTVNEDNTLHDFRIIDTFPKLEEIVKELEKHETIAVDLEADSMYHFNEKICLIQIASKGVKAIIDPLKLKDLSILKQIFYRKDITKLFHGADYDIRSLYRDFDIDVNSLFDTQLACRYLGYKESGLISILKKKLNVALNKKYQKKDWSIRPLPSEMINYALNDVLYLIPLADILTKELKKKGRFQWVVEECENLSNVRPATSHSDPLFMSFKGAGRLAPRSLAILEAILEFRKNIAKKKNKPLFKVFGNDSILKIALERPLSLKGLKKIKALSLRQISMYGAMFVKIIHRAYKIPVKELPFYPRKKSPKLNPEISKRIQVIKLWRSVKSKDLRIDPSLLLNKSLMISLANKNPLNLFDIEKIDGMRKWKKDEFGSEIIQLFKQLESKKNG